MRHVYTTVGASTVGAVASLLPISDALCASRSVSPTAQIREVESLLDLTVMSVTPKGDELIEKAKKQEAAFVAKGDSATRA